MRYSMFIPGFVLAIALSQARAEPPRSALSGSTAVRRNDRRRRE